MGRRFLAALGISAVLHAGCGRGRAARVRPVPAPPRLEIAASATPADGTVDVEMRNVDFRVDEFVVLRIRRLVGTLVSTRSGSPPVFDDKNSFVLRIKSGEIAIDAAGLSAIMNRYAFAAPDAPMKEISIEIRGDGIRQRARLRKTGLPVEIDGRLDATSDGRIRLRPESIRVAHLPVRGIMAFLKLKLGKLVDLTKARGVEESGNDLLLSPDGMLPPPRIEGRISSVRIEDGRLVEVFGSDGGERPRDRAGNFMHYRNGTLRFGKLTMHDADLEILDSSPEDPFDFFLDHYKEQLVAGYSKTTPTFGLRVFMPDFHQLGRPATKRRTAS
ncbi:MAG TPA: hypothetical protein VKS03_02845 [Thermoanaerobaculia bacterium]|nr:hypothetical protein [Thermoanaerobaculia bacterium]